MADADDDACSSCGGEAWIDLSHTNTAAMLRERERSHPELSRSETLGVEAGLAAIFAVASAAGIALSLITLPVIGTVTSLVVSTMLVRTLRQPISQAVDRRASRRELPARRRLALPPAEGVVGRLRGQAMTQSILRSPIGNRPCLAWRVRARLVEGESGRLIIDDTRSAAFELGGKHFEADGIELEGQTERVELSELAPDARERATRFLRERGCFSHEGAWIIEEEWIGLDGAVEVEGRGRQQAPIVRVNDELASPYR